MARKLIELVRQNVELYDMSCKKYSDTLFKEEIWKKIGLAIGRPGSDCRLRWVSLRDQFRKVIRNKTKSVQAAT
ncbi:transcription factor Adf-1-like [Schistocerca piceifrons]|uniref:transcription factor Adf-1-like n=1 Tax=Schistocerca piceifrons TaxID=274613 RepID=UPI001F5EB298|nr:transcription factor Adf-1-like [Schistocerca piceifrons]